MGGVDTTDATMKACSGQRNDKKVHQKIILHLFHRHKFVTGATLLQLVQTTVSYSSLHS
jgi:hypothetical protein